MKIKLHSRIYVFCALLAILLAGLACSAVTEDNSGNDLAVQQTMIAIQQTQMALDNAIAQQSQPEPEEQVPQVQPPVEQPVEEPVEIIEEQPDVVFEGISFSFDPAITGSISPATIPAQNKGPESFPGDNYPTHFEFNFNNYAAGDQFHTPIIRVYPIDEFRMVDSYASGIIDELKQALISRPTGGAIGYLPFLPRWNAAQMFSANVEYFDFQNGSGVRFLTMYGQALYPVDNTNLFYTYQGITHDGRFYISGILPVTHPGLPDEGQTTDFLAFEENWDTYINQTINWLAAQDKGSFNPGLDLLDAMMASFKIDR